MAADSLIVWNKKKMFCIHIHAYNYHSFQFLPHSIASFSSTILNSLSVILPQPIVKHIPLTWGKYLPNMNKFCDWLSETKVISVNDPLF